MATKKVDTKSRSANPRASAAKAKPAAKAKAQPASKAKAEASSKANPRAKATEVVAKAKTPAPKATAPKVTEQAKKTVAETTTQSKQSAPKKTIVSITFEQIAKRAYELWAERGYSHGNDVDDWCRAEAELSIK